MKITTEHTLTFRMQTYGNEMHTISVGMIKLMARNMGVGVSFSNPPLPDGADTSERTTRVNAMTDSLKKCDDFWQAVANALKNIGAVIGEEFDDSEA